MKHTINFSLPPVRCWRSPAPPMHNSCHRNRQRLVNIGAEASIQIDHKGSHFDVGRHQLRRLHRNHRLHLQDPHGGGQRRWHHLEGHTDFSGSGGPSVASPPTTGDTLSYTCTLSSPGTASAGNTATTTMRLVWAPLAPTSVSAKTGNSRLGIVGAHQRSGLQRPAATRRRDFTIHAV